MSSNVAGPEIERLIQLLARLPGLGPRSARRAALHLIRKRETLLEPLAEAMRVAEERIVDLLGLRQRRHARSLHDLRRPSARSFDPRRRRIGRRSLGAGARGRDPGALSRARRRAVAARRRRARRSQPRAARRARRRGRGRARSSSPSTRRSTARRRRITSPIASPPIAVKVTRLAHGVPVGGELDYLDDGTLAAAMRQRTAF